MGSGLAEKTARKSESNNEEVENSLNLLGARLATLKWREVMGTTQGEDGRRWLGAGPQGKRKG